MGRAELENIRKLCKISDKKKGGGVLAAWGVCAVFYLFMEFDWLIRLVRMCITGEKCEEIVFANGVSYLLPFAAMVFTCICTFYKETYKGNISTYPQNNVTTYISQWIMTLKVGGIITLMTGVISVIGYVVACVASNISGRMEILNVITPKYFVIMTIYMLLYFVLVDAVIKFAGVVFRKSRLVFGIIVVVSGVIAYFRLKMHTPFLIVNFFIKENKFALLIVKVIVITVICFVVGYILERKIKNSKSEISENKVGVIGKGLVGIGIYIIVFGGIVCFGVLGNIESDSEVTQKQITTKEYELKLPEEKVKYKSEIDDSMELLNKGISRLRILEAEEPKVVVKKYENENSQIKDIYKDMDFKVDFKDGKIYIENKSLADMYLYIPMVGLSNRQLQSFLGNEVIECYDDTELRERYLTTYDITIYIPEEYLDEEVDLEYYDNWED